MRVHAGRRPLTRGALLAVAGLVGFVVLGWFVLGSVAERTALYPAPPAGDGDRELAASGGKRLWLDVAGAKVEA